MGYDSSFDELYYSYTKVKPGTYYCTECPEDPAEVVIDKKNNCLPECPKCKNPTFWSKSS